MIIHVTTIREIEEEDFWPWAESVIDSINEVKKIDIMYGMNTKLLNKIHCVLIRFENG